jgi:hypothetical protein
VNFRRTTRIIVRRETERFFKSGISFPFQEKANGLEFIGAETSNQARKTNGTPRPPRGLDDDRAGVDGHPKGIVIIAITFSDLW